MEASLRREDISYLGESLEGGPLLIESGVIMISSREDITKEYYIGIIFLHIMT